MRAEPAWGAVGSAQPPRPPLDEDELRALFRELTDLPAHDLTLLVPLRELVSPELERLYQAIEADDPDTAEEVFPAVLAKVDTLQTRPHRYRRHQPRGRRADRPR